MSAANRAQIRRNGIAIQAMLCAQDYAINEIAEETGAHYQCVARFIKRHMKTGEVECVSNRRTTRFRSGSIAARYVWVGEPRQAQSEALIYRLVDRLLDIPLDQGGIELIREAQQFLGAGAL